MPGSLGVWTFTDDLVAPQALALARRIEALGYHSLWLPETVGRDPLAHSAYLGAGTSSLRFGTGIANIYNRHAGVMRQAAETVAEQSGGRFVLGLGVSHTKTVTGLRGLDHTRPLERMRRYLDEYADSPYRGPLAADHVAVVLAALGPRMLALTTSPEHTAQARAILGPDKQLVVEQKVVLTGAGSTDAARLAARTALGVIVGLPSYRSCWLRLGFSETELDDLDDRFVDAMVAIGDSDALCARVQSHLDAGASLVVIQALRTSRVAGPDLDALTALAPLQAALVPSQ